MLEKFKRLFQNEGNKPGNKKTTAHRGSTGQRVSRAAQVAGEEAEPVKTEQPPKTPVHVAPMSEGKRVVQAVSVTAEKRTPVTPAEAEKAFPVFPGTTDDGWAGGREDGRAVTPSTPAEGGKEAGEKEAGEKEAGEKLTYLNLVKLRGPIINIFSTDTSTKIRITENSGKHPNYPEVRFFGDLAEKAGTYALHDHVEITAKVQSRVKDVMAGKKGNKPIFDQALDGLSITFAPKIMETIGIPGGMLDAPPLNEVWLVGELRGMKVVGHVSPKDLKPGDVEAREDGEDGGGRTPKDLETGGRETGGVRESGEAGERAFIRMSIHTRTENSAGAVWSSTVRVNYFCKDVEELLGRIRVKDWVAVYGFIHTQKKILSGEKRYFKDIYVKEVVKVAGSPGPLAPRLTLRRG